VIKGYAVESDPAVYINNCRFGLHGPIEVLSRGAVTAYVRGLSQCSNLNDEEWGEDKWLDRCSLQLGLTRVNMFGLLSEVACGEQPAPCGGPDVAFHPFKSVDSYMACQSFAMSFGDDSGSDDDHEESDRDDSEKPEPSIVPEKPEPEIVKVRR